MQTSHCQRSKNTTKIPTSENLRWWKGWELVCRGRLWVRSPTLPTTWGAMDWCQRVILELQRSSQKWSYGFVSKRSPLELIQSFLVAWGTTALSSAPALVPPRLLFWFSLASPSVATKLSHHVLLTVSLVFFFCAYLYKRKRLFFFFFFNMYI